MGKNLKCRKNRTQRIYLCFIIFSNDNNCHAEHIQDIKYKIHTLQSPEIKKIKYSIQKTQNGKKKKK